MAWLRSRSCGANRGNLSPLLSALLPQPNRLLELLNPAYTCLALWNLNLPFLPILRLKVRLHLIHPPPTFRLQ